MPAPGKLSEILMSRTRAMIYGWPTVVVIDRNHMPKVAPLFAVQIEPKRGSDNQWAVHGKTEPEFNLARGGAGCKDATVGPLDLSGYVAERHEPADWSRGVAHRSEIIDSLANMHYIFHEGSNYFALADMQPCRYSSLGLMNIIAIISGAVA